MTMGCRLTSFASCWRLLVREMCIYFSHSAYNKAGGKESISSFLGLSKLSVMVRVQTAVYSVLSEG